jgi:cation diffusion facilitator family transporter
MPQDANFNFDFIYGVSNLLKAHGTKAWSHEHVFLSATQLANARRTWLVIALTATMMVLEIASGFIFGSMALLADGWHMASHAAALGISAVGYSFARRHASDKRFSFGTGKISELAGYSSALLLALIALLMAYESVRRLFSPVVIKFDEAIAVAVLGLLVNLASAFILRERHAEHDHEHHTDHNLRAAYLHVLADALTSILAIVALTTGRFLGWVWMDPLMGIVGAVVIARWSYGLTRDTGSILLDIDINTPLTENIRQRLESDGDNRIIDLHLWRLGPGHFAVIISLTTNNPHSPSYYKEQLSEIRELRHITVEVNTGLDSRTELHI